MTVREPGQDAILTAEEIAVIRRALVTCTQVLAWAEQLCGAQFRATVAQAAEAAGLSRSPGHLASDVHLAIDCLDSATPARRTR